MKKLQKYHSNDEEYDGVLNNFNLKQLAIYIPPVNQTLKVSRGEQQVAMEQCKVNLRKLAGAISVSEIQNKNSRVKESITKINVFLSEITSEIREQFLGLCLWLKGYLNQKRIAIEINSKLILF